MNLYPISFIFDGKTYTANFERLTTNPIQYHIYDVEPGEFSKFLNLIFFANEIHELLIWIDEPTITEKEKVRQFKMAISKAIFKKCEEENISVFG